MGPVKIERSKVLSRDVMLAKLGGVTDATVAAVKHRGKFHFVAPAELGGVIQGVPADSLTDCMNWSV